MPKKQASRETPPPADVKQETASEPISPPKSRWQLAASSLLLVTWILFLVWVVVFG